MVRVQSILTFANLLGLSLCFACGGGGGGSTPPPPVPTLTALALTPANPSVSVGASSQFTATGTYSDNSTRDLTTSVTWTSGTPTTATITGGGTATGVAGGSSVITANQGAISGHTTLTVTTGPAVTLTSLVVSPATASLAKTATRQFTATGAYSDGTSKDVTGSVTWTSGTPAMASVSTAGLVTGLAGGSSIITATQGTIHGSSTVTVTVPSLTALAITPTQAVVSQRGTYTYIATGTFSDGTTSPVAASWTSADPSIATVGATTGTVTGGPTYGQTTITATSGSFSATATIINDYPVPTKLDITPTASSVLVGASLKLTASVTWSDGSVSDMSGPSAWSTSSSAIASLVGAGTVKGVAPGTVTISAIFTSQSNTSGTTIVSGNVTLNVTASSLTSLAVTPASAPLVVGGTLNLTAAGTYADGHTADLTAASTWTSNNTAVATVATNGSVTAHAAGTATLTATVGAISGSATVAVSAGAALTGITVTPASQTLAVGATSQYTAMGVFSDGTGHQLSTGVTWTVSAPAVATTNAFGLVTAAGAGTATVTATSAGVTGSASLTVNAPPPSFDSRLVGNWQWLGFPDMDGNSYGSFYVFNANGTFTYDLIYLGSGINCIYFNKVVAHHEGTFSSLGSLSDITNAGKIIFTCTVHHTDYTSCSGSTTRNAWTGANPHFHFAAFADANHLVSTHADDWVNTGAISHVKH